jgi:putative nucleotidyltransferase with HDIG domain
MPKIIKDASVLTNKQKRSNNKHKRIVAFQKKIIEAQKQTIAAQTEELAAQVNGIRVKDTLYLEAQYVLKAFLDLIARIIELRDPYTEGHSRNVANLSMAIAEHSGIDFDSEVQIQIQYAALLHDVGKVAITEYILNKPTQLNAAEMAMVREHTRFGYDLLKPLGLDPVIGEVVLYHHENYDGSGYLAGLKGVEIPLAARIVRIADMYDALTSNRPYRQAYSRTDALEIMKKSRQHFDPFLFEVFQQIIAMREG